MFTEYFCHKIFDIGVDSNRAMMKSIDLTGEYLALGCNRGKIFVFCMKTKELVRAPY
jgi:hypothetical protein